MTDELRTARLVLRQWRDEDREPFAALNADPVVMRYFPEPLPRAASDALVDRHSRLIAERGWGWWALEAAGSFIGFVGLQPVGGDLPCHPAVEIGWRLAASSWGNGYAPEAARAVLDVAWQRLGLDEVVSFTTERNAPSRRVMEKIGMRHQPERDFDHPRVAGWVGQRHVLYAISRP